MRKRLHQLVERQVKRQGWKRLALLGLDSSRTLVHLLATCPHLEILAVDDFERPGVRAANREAWRAKARLVVAGAKDRCVLREVSPLEAANLMKGTVDAVAMDLDGKPDTIAAVIAAWKPHVTGAFMGTDWSHNGTRKWLSDNRGGWTKLEGGTWMSKVAQPMQEAA